jgi:hypothetical protein
MWNRREYSNKNKEKIKVLRQRHYSKLRDQIFDTYGRECSCCGEKEPKFLSLDHVYNDSYKTRPSGAINFYIAVRREGFPKDRYQILCMNCNHGKSRNKGICPHKGESK